MVINVRNLAAFFMSRYFILAGKISGVIKRASRGEIILSVYFHDPSLKLFESTVKWFLKKGFTFISIDELEQVARGENPFPTNAVLLTADDGWKNNKENISEIANRYKVPVTIFASTQPIFTGEAYWWSYIARGNREGLISESVQALKKMNNEERVRIVDDVKAKVPLHREALTVSELREISDSPFVSIGSHTVTHPILSNCSDEQSQYEITESQKLLRAWLGKEVKHFAYPNGNYTERDIQYLQQSGYNVAFTTNPQYITPKDLQNLYTLPRFDVLEDVSFTENICRMTGVWFNRKIV